MGKRILFIIVVLFAGNEALSQEQVSVTRSNLEKHVYTLASDQLLGRRAGTGEGAMATSYIEMQFRDIGLFPGAEGDDNEKSFIQRFEKHSGKYANVIGFISGSDPELREEYIVLGAHYDHLGYRIRGADTIIYHGADDNASGTAVLIEAARNLMERKDELKRTVIIAAFDAEESGLYGSDAMVGFMDTGKVKFMAGIDMVGWLRQAGKLEINGVGMLDGGKALMEAVPHPEALVLEPVAKGRTPFTASDHDSFRAADVPAVLITTGTVSPYHKPEDTADKIDYEGMEMITEYVTDLTVGLAARDEIVAADRQRQRKGGASTVEFAITGSVGTSRLSFPKSSVSFGRARFSWNAGVFLQFNFNESLALRPEALYNHRTFRYPQANAAGELVVNNSYRKYVSPALTVPVNLLWKLAVMDNYYLYIGAGGYYSYVFNAAIDGRKINFNRHEGGISVTVGLNLDHVGLSYTGYIPVSFISQSGIRMRGNSSYFTMYYRF